MRANQPDHDQTLTLVEAIIPIAALILLIAASYYLFGDAGSKGPNQVALTVAAMIAVFIAWRRGHTLDDIRAAAVESVGSGVGAIFILLVVGALIGTWALSGTLLAMIYYGLQLLSPNYFYLTAALICAMVSVGIGSSWTVVGTIGVGLMGISANMGLNPGITAAAVISGAYFGDTTSPLSDSLNLAVAAAGVEDPYQHVRETALASAVALAIALGVFWALGQPGAFDASDKMTAIENNFHMSLWLFVPLVVVVTLALCKLPPVTTIFIGAIVGGLLAVMIAPDRVVAFASAGSDTPRWLALLKGVWLALATGYVSRVGYPAIDQLLSRGGMESMMDTVWLIITALAFGGIVEKAGVLDRLLAPVLRAARSVGALVTSLVAAVIATNIVAADQYIAVVLPARMFKSSFAARGLAPVTLSRAVGAAATPTSALIPWNSCGAYMAVTLGVATLSYLPYAVFSFASPLLAIVMAYTGVRMLRDPSQRTAANGDVETLTAAGEAGASRSRGP